MIAKVLFHSNLYNTPFLNGIDFKFVSHRLWSEKQNVLLQHMHKKEFSILTNKWGKILNTKTRLNSHGLVFVFTIISTFIGQISKFFFMHVL